MSDEDVPRVYTLSFEYLQADLKLLKSVLSNVAFNCEVNLHLDYGLVKNNCEFDLKTFRPRISFSLHSFLSVDLNLDFVIEAVSIK